MRTRLILTLSLLVAGVTAHAQTFYGPGGLIINPTGYTNPKGLLQLNASIFNRQSFGSDTGLVPVSLTYAFSDRFEAGPLFIGQLTGATRHDMGGVYFKEGITGETKDRPAMAFIGTSVLGDGTINAATFMASKKISKGVHLHIGGRYVNYGTSARPDGNAIIGTDIQFAPAFRLIAEADSRLRLFHYGSEAFGIQYMGAVTITVGMVNQATNHYSFFFGVGYPVGKP